MNETMSETLSVVVEREMPHPAEKIWRALTLPHLMEEWLMKNNFALNVGHRFDLSAEWGSVNCEVLDIEPITSLSYTWNASAGHVASDLKSVVTWTLTPTENGTLLRMEQTGFRQDQPQYYGGAKAGWPRFFDGLEQVLAKLD